MKKIIHSRKHTFYVLTGISIYFPVYRKSAKNNVKISFKQNQQPLLLLLLLK